MEPPFIYPEMETFEKKAGFTTINYVGIKYDLENLCEGSEVLMFVTKDGSLVQIIRQFVGSTDQRGQIK